MIAPEITNRPTWSEGSIGDQLTDLFLVKNWTDVINGQVPDTLHRRAVYPQKSDLKKKTGIQ